LPVYILREQNIIQKIFQDHFSDFKEGYQDHYAKQYDKYRIIHIKEAVTTAVVVSYQTYGDFDDIDPTRSLGVIRQEELNSELSMSLIFCFAQFFPAGLFPGHQCLLVRLPQRGIYDSPP